MDKTLEKKTSVWGKLWRNVCKYPLLYFMILPVLVYYVIFHYIPIYGLVISFQNYNPARGILGSKWVGFTHLINFVNDVYFTRVVRNTILINLYLLLFGFPVPIIFALLLAEVRNRVYARFAQSITYIPHFISAVVFCGLVLDFVKSNGVITSMLANLGFEPINLLTRASYFRPIYVGANIWQQFGWDSIIYIAALTAVDPTFYEAAIIAGASRFQRVWHISLPSILPTIVILIILRIGNLMSLSWEKIFLLYNPMIYETADVISTYSYRRGLELMEYSFGSVISLFNGTINLLLLTSANWLSRKINGIGLW